MKRNLAVTWIVLVVASMMFVGCAKPPTADLDAAKTALTAAENVEASVYADAELNEAKQAIAAAEAELATQQGKFALTRNYDAAKQLIADAANKATAAQQAAVEGKEAAVKMAEGSLAALNTAMTSIDGMVAHLKACPKKPKGFDADMLVIGTQVDALKAEVGPVQQAISDGDFKGAVARAEAVQTQAAALSADLQNAATKINCPMPEPAPATEAPATPTN
jgi:hypothetical protein